MKDTIPSKYTETILVELKQANNSTKETNYIEVLIIPIIVIVISTILSVLLNKKIKSKKEEVEINELKQSIQILEERIVKKKNLM